MLHRNRFRPAWTSIVVWWLMITQSLGCPLCEALSGTLSDDLATARFAAIAKVQDCRFDASKQLFRVSFCTADVEQIAAVATAPAREFTDVWMVDPIPPDQPCLLLAYSEECERPDTAAQTHSLAHREHAFAWSAPQPLSNALREYLLSLPLDADDPTKLIFFFDHLLSADAVVRDDAYSECARTPLTTIRGTAFRQHVDIADIARRVANPECSNKSKCFYWMLIAEFGGPDQLHLFDQIALPVIELHCRSRETPSPPELPMWTAAAIACQCTLAHRSGRDHLGLDRIDRSILQNAMASIGLKVAAMNALRVLADDTQSIPVASIAKVMESVLRDPDTADFVISDLARWKHWECLPKIMELYEIEDDNSSLVRVPIINFLRVCPRPEAAIFLERIKRQDPRSYRRAMTLLPVLPIPDSAPQSNSK